MKQETREKLERAGLLQPKENTVPEQQGIVFTPEMLEKLISGLQTSTIDAIRELKKRSPEEQEEYDKKKERERQHRVARVKEAVQDERLRKEREFICLHVKSAEGVSKQEHAFRGQVNNDNCCRAQCIRCHKLFPPFKVSEENIRSGMSLQNLKNLTAEGLWEAHIKSFPNCKECAAGHCAVGDRRQKRQGFLDAAPSVLPDGKIFAESLTA